MVNNFGHTCDSTLLPTTYFLSCQTASSHLLIEPLSHQFIELVHYHRLLLRYISRLPRTVVTLFIKLLFFAQASLSFFLSYGFFMCKPLERANFSIAINKLAIQQSPFNSTEFLFFLFFDTFDYAMRRLSERERDDLSLVSYDQRERRQIWIRQYRWFVGSARFVGSLIAAHALWIHDKLGT